MSQFYGLIPQPIYTYKFMRNEHPVNNLKISGQKLGRRIYFKEIFRRVSQIFVRSSFVDSYQA